MQTVEKSRVDVFVGKLLEEMRVQFPDQALCWKVIKKLRCPAPMVSIDIGTLQRHFSGIFHRQDRLLFILQDPVAGWGVTRPEDVHFDEPFTDEDLLRALRDLNGQAGTGPQRIPSQVIKEVFADKDSRSVLLLLMNLCFQEGVIPTPWGMAELFVLHKGKGLLTIADNYRAIALSDDFRRVYERLVQQRLAAWSYQTNAMGIMQFGFKQGTGTLEAIFVLRTVMFFVTKVLKVPGFALFIDLKKAFPSMSRPKIVETLRSKAAPWKVTRAVASLLSGSTQRLKVNGRLTESFFVTTGTPEGSINSPEIFSVVYKALLEGLDIHELPSDLTKLEAGKVYYIVFADDLSFFTLSVGLLGPKASELKVVAEPYDMSLNAGKCKWVAFLPESPTTPPLFQEWRVEIDGDEIENLDEFTYLGYCLDCKMTERAHEKLISERYIRAAKVTGKLMRDLKCTDLRSLRKFFISMVFSQLYGLIFVNTEGIEFERGIGIFLKASLGLPDSFPHVVACALMGIKDLTVFQTQQRFKFLLRWELRTGNGPVFSSLVLDRCVLFPQGVGLNACLGDILAAAMISRTIDYKIHADSVCSLLEAQKATEHRGKLFSTEGRAFWTELGPTGTLPPAFKQAISRLPFEQARIVFLLFGDMLCWAALKCPTRKCPTCSSKFSTEHFFSCPQIFAHDQGWRTFVQLCRVESWSDVVDLIFAVLRKWVDETSYFRANFRLHILEYVNMSESVEHVAFRWNFV